ncbi:hypothetical protein [Streptomyces sp. NPDC001678]|uniref:hypothetical protein n=1 Tax=Streptomyces sp. NPDC001678 TaxID=3364599 RepID=UPI00369AC3A7
MRHGEVPWARAEAWAARLFEECEEALRGTPLPAEPDTARVEDFLIRVRRTGISPSGV